MKMYTKPEIEALALETVDVIETSFEVNANKALAEQGVTAEVLQIEQQIAEMSTDWQW